MKNDSTRDRARQPRPDLTEFATGEIMAELAMRYTAAGYGWLADVWRQARQKALASADPALADKHRQVFYHLLAELRRRAA